MSASHAGFPVEDFAHVAAVRREAQRAAQSLDFSEARAGQVALIVSELGTNLVKHATRGEILLRMTDEHVSDRVGLEVLALDHGPGIPDVALSAQDGYSTAGSLGHGLGAIRRQSDFLDIYTQPSGTAILARIGRDARPAPERRSRLEIGAVQVNATGERVSGDDWMTRMRDGRFSLLMADGLGHGLAAHEAARRAVTEFDRLHDEESSTIVGALHAALRSTRGAAVAVAILDIDRGVVRYSGLGNIAGVILAPGSRGHSMVSQNGTAGLTATRIQEFQYPFSPESILLMHSDGLGTHWDLAAYPGLRSHHSSLIAGVIYRDFSRRRDDVTIVVVKDRPGMERASGAAEKQ
jgi:anti-sigma regulatory factor (Ser/Thr protein kinase)